MVNKVFGFGFDYWTLWGLFAQFLFFFSFIVQWYKSEKAKKSHIPVEFWIMRLVATIMLISYVYQKRDLVFMISSILQIAVYGRNIWLIKSENDKNKT